MTDREQRDAQLRRRGILNVHRLVCHCATGLPVRVPVEIDEDVREEYWTLIRELPENKDSALA